MMPAKYLDIAVIGDEDLVSGLRLAGVSRYYIIKGGHDIRDDVRKTLTELIDNPNVGVVVILEDYVEYAEDLVAQVRRGKKITPVIIEVPSKFGTKYRDVREYYKAFVRDSIGFDIEI
jgi:vacuolar-type H+-ATPase subunit F/Vma7